MKCVWGWQALGQIGRAPRVKTHVDSMTSQKLIRLPGEYDSVVSNFLIIKINILN